MMISHFNSWALIVFSIYCCGLTFSENEGYAYKYRIYGGSIVRKHKVLYHVKIVGTSRHETGVEEVRGGIIVSEMQISPYMAKHLPITRKFPVIPADLFITGNGQTETESISEKLKGAYMLKAHGAYDVYRDEFVGVGYHDRPTTNACFGDIGGPAVCNHPSTREKLCGMILAAMAPPGQPVCEDGVTIFLDIGQYRNEIIKTIHRSL